VIKDFLILFLGFAVLIKSADWLIRGAVLLARRFHVSDWLVGITLVAFGSSLPELVVNVTAVFTGNTTLAVSNIMGSVTANVLLVLGICLLVTHLVIGSRMFRVDLPVSVLSMLGVGVLAMAGGGSGSSWVLARWGGAVLLSAFVLFSVYLLKQDNGRVTKPGAVVPNGTGVLKMSLMAVVGLAGLCLGAQWIVGGATGVALRLGVSQAFIGFTIVAVGTSLPELAASFTAAKRGNHDIAVANVIGSNIFNCLMILGVSSAVRPLPFTGALVQNWAVATASSVLLFLCFALGKRYVVGKKTGILFLLLYAAYLAYLTTMSRA